MIDNQELTSKELYKELDELRIAHDNLFDIAESRGKQLTQAQQKLDVAVEALEFYSEFEEDCIRIECHEDEDINKPCDIGKVAKAALNTIRGKANG